MIARKARLPLILISIVSLVAACGCSTNNAGKADSLPGNKYVAVEESMTIRCTLINGSYGLLPHATPSDSFIYDGSLNGDSTAYGGWTNLKPEALDNYYPAINDSFKVLLGTYYYRELSPGDMSTGLRVKGVYNFPYALQSGFVLRDIDRNGTIYGSYGNASIVLLSGELWETPTVNEIASGSGTGW
ncbi:MAG TPA: hypothetical protein VLT35_04765, partial [Methanocella sp.]|nr:hypothetical protein [Methanocella sp.]